MKNSSQDLREMMRFVSGFPDEKSIFWDITPIFQDKDTFSYAVDSLYDSLVNKKIDKIAGIEARGFIVASALAYKMNKGIILLRKHGKLPYHKISEEYRTRYASGTLDMHVDAINKGDRVLIIDDTISTGGTAVAAIRLIERACGIVSGIGAIIYFPSYSHMRDIEELLEKYGLVYLVNMCDR